MGIIAAIDGGMINGGIVSFAPSGKIQWDLLHPTRGHTVPQVARAYFDAFTAQREVLGAGLPVDCIGVETYRNYGAATTAYDIIRLSYCIIGMLAVAYPMAIVQPVMPDEWREYICRNKTADHTLIEHTAQLRQRKLFNALATALSRKEDRSHIYDAALIADYCQCQHKTWRATDGRFTTTAR